MGVKEDIEKMYENLYNSKLGDLDRIKNETLLGLTNRETGINNQYKETEGNIGKSRKDTENLYLDRYNTLDNDFQSGQKKFYGDRNNAAVGNAKNTQAIRDYMARANLIQSGESVDALLRQQTDYTNTQNSIYSQEGDFNKNIDNTRSQYKRDEASAYTTLDNQLAAALREKDLSLAAILSERDQANKSYNSGLSSLKNEVEYGKLKELNAYNQMLEERAYQDKVRAEERAFQERMAQQAQAAQAARYSSSSSGGGSSSKNASQKDLKAEFTSLMQSQNNYQARDFLDKQKDYIVNSYGPGFYKELYDMYWDDLAKYYSR